MLRRSTRRLRPRAPNLPVPPAATTCSKCAAAIGTGETFCGQCGNPIRSGAKPKTARAEIHRRITRLKHTRLIRSGRSTIFYLAIGMLVVGLISYLSGISNINKFLALPLDDPQFISDMQGYMGAKAFEQARWLARHYGAIHFITFGLPALIYTGLYLWAAQHALAATITALLVYLTFAIVGILLNPLSLVSPVGWIIRIAIIGALGNAIKSANAEQQRLKREKTLARIQLKKAQESEPVDEPHCSSIDSESVLE